MDYIEIGKIVNTHGIKGEIRLLSEFEAKEYVFQKGVKIYIGKEKQEEIICTYRKHKMFDMITLEGIYNINDILKYKGEYVFVTRSSFPSDVILNQDYIGLEVYTDHYIGTVISIMNNHAHDILIVKNEEKEYLIPKVDSFIEKIDFENNKIYIKEIEGLIDED